MNNPEYDAQIKKEELIANFHTWLQSHFGKEDVTYVNALVDSVDEETFLAQAEKWAENTIGSKLHY